MGHTCSKSSPNRIRSSEPKGGNSTNSSVGQLPLPELSWVGLTLGRVCPCHGCSSKRGDRGGRKGGEQLTVEAKRAVYSRPRGFLNRLRNVLGAGGEINPAIAIILEAGCLLFPLTNFPRSSTNEFGLRPKFRTSHGVVRTILASSHMEVASSVIPMRRRSHASAPRTEVQVVGAWLWGDRVGSNKRQTSGEGEGTTSATCRPRFPSWYESGGRELDQPLVNLPALSRKTSGPKYRRSVLMLWLLLSSR